MRCATDRFWVLSVGGPIGVAGKFRDSQGSVHKLEEVPSPIILPSWDLSNSLPMQIPLQPCEQDAGGLLSRNWLVWHYLPRKVFVKRQSGFVRIRQLNLARTASLKLWKSLKPKPPANFAFIRVFQKTQHIFFFSIESSHQNLVKADWILLYNDPVSLKHDIVYAGIDARTDFNMMTFPAAERNLEDQLHARCLIRSTIMLNKSFFFRPNNSCNPRYLPEPPSFGIPICILTLSFSVACVFAEKVTADFCELIFWPEATSYLCRMSSNAVHSFASDLQKNIVSSANSMWFNLGLFFPTLIPVRLFSRWALIHRPDRTSLQRMKTYGDSGSPWRRPLCGVISPWADPLSW